MSERQALSQTQTEYANDRQSTPKELLYFHFYLQQEYGRSFPLDRNEIYSLHFFGYYV